MTGIPGEEYLRFAADAFASHDGETLPLTIEVDGEKQVIGEATIHAEDGGFTVESKITDDRYLGLLQPGEESISFRVNP